MGSPGGAVVKNPPTNAGASGDLGSIPGSGRYPGVRKGNPLQHSCPENSTDRRAWQAIVHEAAKSWTHLSTSMMCCSPTGDKYLLHHFIWIKPGVVTYKEKIG